MVNQVDFLLDKVGLDGVYVDQFNQADLDSDQTYSYNKYDKWSAKLDPDNLSVEKRFFDTAISTIDFQKEFLNYVSNKSKLVVVNSHPLYEENINNVIRFGEGFWGFLSLNHSFDEKPPSNIDIAKGHLSSPISIGLPEWLTGSWQDNFTEVTIRNIIYYLRNGSLYYYSSVPSGINQDPAFKVVNSLYPITPILLGEGWIQGKERLISAVSNRFVLESSDKPTIKVFNLDGFHEERMMPLRKKESSWILDLELKDWNEVAIIEYVEN